MYQFPIILMNYLPPFLSKIILFFFYSKMSICIMSKAFLGPGRNSFRLLLVWI